MAAPGCREPDPKIVKLAVVAPFSGRYHALGDNVLLAAKLAVGEWNGRGGVAGYRIEVVAQDDRNGAEGGALQAKKMVIDPDVIGVVGHLSRASILAAASEYERAGMPALALGALPEALAEGRSVLGVTAGERAVARAMARFIGESGFRRVALIADSSMTRDETRLIREALGQGSLSVHETRLDESSDLRELAQRMLAESPDLVLFPGSFVRGAGLLKELRALDSRVVYLGGSDHALPDFPAVAGDAAEGAYYVSLGRDPGHTLAARGFAQEYKARFGVEPTAWASVAYDASNIMLAAVEQTARRQGKPTRAAAVVALADFKSYSGVTGLLSPSPRGNLSEPGVYVYRIVGSNFPGERKWSGGDS